MTIILTDDPVMSGKICAYCSEKTEIIDSAVFYSGRSFGMVRACEQCNAFVGLHKGTQIALGRVAKKELREKRKHLHVLFDKTWKYGDLTRREAYSVMAKILEKGVEETHISWLSDEEIDLIIKQYQ